MQLWLDALSKKVFAGLPAGILVNYNLFVVVYFLLWVAVKCLLAKGVLSNVSPMVTQPHVP